MSTNSKLLTLALCATLFTGCNNDDTFNSDNSIKTQEALNIKYQEVKDQYSVYNTFFKPTEGWVGDPIPFYANGKFHIFYLYDARDGAPTFHPWYKVTTSNFSSYTDNGEMIACGDPDGQERALGTGGIFENNGIYYAFYTGHNGNLDPREKILVATSTDLEHWTKDESFVLEASWGYDRNEFRDPIIIKDNASGTFKMLISTRADYKGSWRAVIAQYSSNNLRNWTLEEPFYDDPNTFMVECPDIFTMGEYQYLIYSDIDDRMVHYKYRKNGIGEWITPTNSALDGVAFYAGKTVSDGFDRYLVGWCPTRGNHSDYYNFDWAGALIAHKLIQYGDGTIVLTYPHGLNDQLTNRRDLGMINVANTKIESDTYKLSADSELAYSMFCGQNGTYKIKAHIDALTSTSFGFEFGSSENRDEVYAVVFDLRQQHIRMDRRVPGNDPWRIDQVRLNIPENKEFDVTIMVENSICVIYVNHQTVFTNRIYRMNQNPWGIFADNGEIIFSNVSVYK